MLFDGNLMISKSPIVCLGSTRVTCCSAVVRLKAGFCLSLGTTLMRVLIYEHYEQTEGKELESVIVYIDGSYFSTVTSAENGERIKCQHLESLVLLNKFWCHVLVAHHCYLTQQILCFCIIKVEVSCVPVLSYTVRKSS